MRNIIAYYMEQLPDNQYRASDSDGAEATSGDISVLLAFIADHDPDSLHVVHNMNEFIKPIKALLPSPVFKELHDTEKVRWGDFKLFYPEIKGGMLGINHKGQEHIKGNFYQPFKNDVTLYDIELYYPGIKCTTADEVKVKALNLADTLSKMGFEPDRLTTPAAIYQECVLSILPYATIYTLPDDCLTMMEWAANYIREWRSVYKVGIFHYGIAKDYDITSAYPSIIAGLPNMTGATFHYSPDGSIPVEAVWGLIRANIDVKAQVSFLVADDEVCRGGRYQDFISNEEAEYCRNTGIADIDPIEAWFFTLPNNRRVFDYSMRKLYEQRNGSELRSTIAKDMSVSVWGKMQEMRNGEPGQYCNFIYAAMVASRCRLKVMKFIDDYQLHNDLVSVTVDGCIATSDVPGIPTSKAFGEWRVGLDSEAIILDTNFQWIGVKHQSGITAGDLIGEIKAHPLRQDWHNIYLALIENDRVFKTFPRNGYDLIKHIYNSTIGGIVQRKST